MRDRLIAGNWKMNGSTAANADLVAGIASGIPDGGGFRLLVCPPAPYLAAVAQQLAGSDVALGAQNVSQFESGAHTGESSPAMLVDVGCEYVIVGHSERRAMYAESSDVVAAKFVAAQSVGLTPILCLGETLQQREAGRTEAIIDEQLEAVVDAAGIASFERAVIAYEPVWAIGTGLTATPEQAQQVHEHIRSRLSTLDVSIADRVQIVYGGSMKGENAAGLLAMGDIDGGLIGGASLKAGDFLAIANAAAQV